MLAHALKEWAVICRALEQGKQTIIFRKGGLVEPDGGFGVKHKRFWLYPTYLHQQEAGIKPEFTPLLNESEAGKPAPGNIHLSHFAEVTAVYQLHDMVGALLLSPLHIYSEETVHARFRYRSPGLFVLLLRVYRAGKSLVLAESEAYAGCKSWVELDHPLPTEGRSPVLTNDKFTAVANTIHNLLKPIAYT